MVEILDRDKWQEIFSTIRKNKLRSGLTALGVFWGIFMLVFLLGMGRGLENGVSRDFGSSAKNIMVVRSWTTTRPYKGFGAGRYIPLELSDLDVLRQQVEEIDLIAPRNAIGPYSVDYQGINKNYEVRGELTDMPKIMGFIIHEGRYINQSDIDQGRKVTVIATGVKKLLFKSEDCLGKHIKIKGVDFMVVGVFGPEKEGANNRNDVASVVIPISTMDRTYGTQGRLDFMVISAKPKIRVAMMDPKIRTILKELNNIHPDDPQGISCYNMEERYQQIQSLFIGIKGFLWIIGIGTLLAGVIGVSNIMLIIVKERTKEIGIRKALGATPKTIISMIMMESVFITSISGYFGILAGTFLVWGIDSMMKINNIDVDNFYRPEVNLLVATAAISTLIIAGALAGLFPALQASNVNPVIALRDE